MPYFPQRIICLTEETTETLYLLGEQDRIVGISGFTVRPPQARRDKPRVSAFTSAKIGFEEWDDPLITAIRWVLELMELAGMPFLRCGTGRSLRSSLH